MGKKYSINSAGRIVAERDIYSLGGFIPKGTVGGSVKDETQLSQEGECWLNAGDISTRPDVRIKDNAYIGNFFTNENPVHTDGIMEFSGDTLIPGYITVRCPQADPKNNVFIKDSFIGVSMDVLCGPATTTTAFPFEQGDFKKEAAKGTLFTSASMRLDDVSACRNTATLRQGRNTYLYIPTGYRARIFWAYYDTSNQLAYSGESTAVFSGLTKLNHSVYKLAMVSIVKNDGTAMTPANLLSTGAKILGHISGSLLQDFRPESVSGEYAIVNSSFVAETDNFGLTTTQLRFLAGGLYNTNMYTKTDRQDYKPYGTFRNVERLEYTKYLGDSHRTAATRDTYISAYDCPLLRIDSTTYNDALAAKGDLVLRRCIVPKAEFQADVINGNTYEDIDFSCANEDLGFTIAGYTRFISGHKQGIYRMSGGPSSTGFVSHKGNLANTARLYQAEKYIPLDGSIMEQGAYGGGSQIPYESSKSNSLIRVRTGKPLPTFGLVFPSLPDGYSVRALYYLDDDFIIRSTSTDPTGLDTTYPYVVMLFRKDDDSAINVTDFIALNRTLRIIDHTKAPEVTGSAYVGAGCTVRGDVQLHGDPYVNRVLDVNMWERGTASQSVGKSWEDSKISTTLGNRFRLMDTFPVEPGGLITCNSGYWVECGFFDSNGIFISSPGWGRTSNYVPAGTAYAGIVIKKSESASDAGGLITEGDIPLANVKYLRAFKKRRYIVNELDRKSPEDILIGPDYWEQGTAGGGQADAGKTYENLKATSGTTIRLKRPINVSPTSSISSASGFSRYIRVLDAVTKFHLGESLASAKMALLAAIIQKDPSGAITPSEIANSRLVLEFVPQPRIIVPYGSSTLFISGPKIRMYDNAVLSKNLNTPEELILKGDAVVSHLPGGCICGWGDSDAIVKL
ncbi:hypothetical protein [Bacteroides thetaiotaomicron]|uniref:hypothetical protein n=1 Tax=Bacteroides thetaiotaomicron TaxID=818 RepID=UPI00232AC47B|nr:hypothetical protein [Bacteroides thetaiotaomicron]MDC2216675.1 hypothetical protein [Bacteroides thetaiotaomicron]